MAESTADGHVDAGPPRHDVLLATKLHVPRAQPGLVARPRLAGRLDEGLDHGLVLIAAPAGYGKSVLLSQWARAQAQPVAWLSLDGRDNDPVRFWRHVLAALDTVRPGVAQRVGPLAGPPPPPAYNALVTALINDVVGDAGRPDALLVLDDYHLVSSDAVHASVRFLLEHRPPELRIVLAGRSDPPLAWPGTGPGASWGRCAPMTSGSPPGRRRNCSARSPPTSTPPRRPPWPNGPRAGRRACSWRPCRCAASPTSPASWPRSPAVTGTSLTT